MTDFSLRAAGEGRWRLSGDVDFHTAPAIWAQLRPLLSVPGSVVLSLAGVRGINSAGLGLFLEGMGVARHAGCEFRLVDIPIALRDLARLSNVGTLLGTQLPG
jgi:anti-anti-sigma factor